MKENSAIWKQSWKILKLFLSSKQPGYVLKFLQRCKGQVPCIKISEPAMKERTHTTVIKDNRSVLDFACIEGVNNYVYNKSKEVCR